MAALEEVRQHWPGDAFVVVVAGGERDLAAIGVPQALADRGQDAGQFRADQQQPFFVALGRHDLQQRDDLAGVRELVGDQREVRDLGEFLDAYSGVRPILIKRSGS